mmetsp:Transcript_14643/g.55153  ORF Transcript_14643/g.55153 Transcript_14643/m.55153 type:complete len:232 (-) Transcript_14643:42-737(-)
MPAGPTATWPRGAPSRARTCRSTCAPSPAPFAAPLAWRRTSPATPAALSTAPQPLSSRSASTSTSRLSSSCARPARRFKRSPTPSPVGRQARVRATGGQAGCASAGWPPYRGHAARGGCLPRCQAERCAPPPSSPSPSARVLASGLRFGSSWCLRTTRLWLGLLVKPSVRGAPSARRLCSFCACLPHDCDPPWLGAASVGWESRCRSIMCLGPRPTALRIVWLSTECIGAR